MTTLVDRPAPAGPGGSPTVVLGVALAVLLIGSSAVSLSGLLLRERATTVTELAGVRSVDVASDTGDVVVVADGGAVTRVERTDTYAWSGPRVTQQVVGDVLRLRGDCPSWLTSCSVSWVVHVPRGTPVRARSGSGDVTARGTGPLDAQVGSGDLEAVGTVGDVVARTGSGDVRLRDVTADRVTAATGSGDADLSLATSPGSLSASTGSGDLVVLLPDEAGVAYDVVRDTGSGDVDVRVREDARSTRTLTVRTGAGDLRVAYAPG